MRKLYIIILLACHCHVYAQADNEIQVYASPTIQHKWTIFELHFNHTFEGSKMLADPKSARWTNKTLEITHGFGKNFELGFYAFTAFAPSGGFHYLGSQLRPRVTVPDGWRWPFGASLSLELGFFRPHTDSSYLWQGELRPIIDKTFNEFYISFNPNIDFVLSGEKQVGMAPQLKFVYTMKDKLGFGVEYYSSLGTFDDFLPLKQQEHLLGPMIDLYLHPKWEVNTGFLFGLTDGSNQRVFKLLLGRRIGR